MSDYPKDWEEKNLGFLSSIKTGTKNNEDKVSYGKYSFFVRSANVERIDTYSYDTEAILVPGEGNIGSIFHYINGKFDVHQRVYAITNFNKMVNARYIYWYMVKNFGEYALSQTSKATVDSLRLPAFQNFKVFFPSLPEQKAIADTLLTFDKHIENLEKLIEKKKMIREGTLEDLMSRKRRLDGFNGEWEEKELNRICDIYDGTHQTPIYKPNGIRFVSVENIKCLKESDKYISKSDFKRDFKIYPEKNDVLMTRIGDIGTAAIIKDNEKLAYYVSLALFKNIKIDSSYLYHHIGCNHFKDELDKRILHHAVPKKINKNDIGKCKVIYPTDIKEQEAIAAILTSMDAEIEDLEKEKAKIENLKAGAMDDLLNGRVRLI